MNRRIGLMCVLLVLRSSALGLAKFKELFFVAAIWKSGRTVLRIGAIEGVLGDRSAERVYDFDVVMIFLESAAT